MLTLLRLSLEFFVIGFFSVGGGMATVPFLMSLSERTGWFSLSELTSMIAISEATPGPIGINMATYVGYHVGGVPGAILAPLSLSLPAFLIILLLAKLLARLRGNPHFEAIFAAIRPASIGLIASVLLQLAMTTFFPSSAGFMLQWKSLLLFLVLAAGLFAPKVRNLPIPVFLLFSALCGMLFQMSP